MFELLSVIQRFSEHARQAKQVSLQCCGEISRDGLMQLAAMFMVNVRLHKE